MTVFIYIVSGSFSDENYDIKKNIKFVKEKKSKYCNIFSTNL